MNRNLDKCRMLNWITMISFCLTDINLYLDTHPDDTEAIDYFNNYNMLRNQAVKEYTQAFGPLLLDCYQPRDSWTWSEDAMPWEGGKN